MIDIKFYILLFILIIILVLILCITARNNIIIGGKHHIKHHIKQSNEHPIKQSNENSIKQSNENSNEYFKLQYEPWTSRDFQFTNEWMEKALFKNLELMKEWQLPSNIVYLNKIPFGLFHLLNKLNLKYDFREFFETLL